jgi:bifunctional DNA-binding transcriptional regulator/antitoxin component of YhaV-PrlF toxin-antitoxin module
VPLSFRVKLGKTGNSLKITIPKPVIEGFGWKAEDEIEILVTDFGIALRKTAEREPSRR